MIYDIIPTPKFEEDLKFYKKKKKFNHIEEDVNEVVEELEKGNLIGTPIGDIQLPEDEDAYKVRAANTDTNVGKSNGYRIIYYAIKNEATIFLLTVYYKKDDNRVLSKDDLKNLIEKYCK
jgi:mRNA-degrading endonuclease RelE of RelBE toxin-antitoxin system